MRKSCLVLPPTTLLTTLREYDRALRVRWSEALGRFSVERRHGVAGDNQKVLHWLHKLWKLAEQKAKAQPTPQRQLQERRIFDEFQARCQGYQPILYLWPKQVGDARAVIELLASADIRRFGGALGYWRRLKEEQEREERREERVQQERIRAANEEIYDRVKTRKDFHAGGGIFGYKDAFKTEKPVY